MSVALRGDAVARLRTLNLVECAPVALQEIGAVPPRSRDWTQNVASDVIDAVTGAVLLGSASEVLIPAPLAVTLQTLSAKDRALCEDWATMVQEQKVRVLATPDEVHALLDDFPCFRRFCVAVPGGPLISQLAFHSPVHAFYDERIPLLCRRFAEEASRGKNGPVSWHAWMRSALTCRYEGLFVPPIRVSDYTAQLMSRADRGGAEKVVWEEGVCGLTTRWFETAIKTAMACGVAPSSLSLALCARPPSEPLALVAKAIDMGVSSFCTCSASEVGLFPGADALSALSDLNRFTVGWNGAVDDATTKSATWMPTDADEGEEQLHHCEEYVRALTARFVPPESRSRR